MNNLLRNLLRLAEYSFTDIDFEWEQLTEAEKQILSKDDMEEIKRLVELKNRPLPEFDDLEISVRTYNNLTKNNVTTTEQILDLGWQGLRRIKHFGRKQCNDVAEALLMFDVRLPEGEH